VEESLEPQVKGEELKHDLQQVEKVEIDDLEGVAEGLGEVEQGTASPLGMISHQLMMLMILLNLLPLDVKLLLRRNVHNLQDIF